ncbi:hypothetical protein EQG49_06110 [Periweissella cryptocerci]|uniref:Uncharacterized protein n=1 Tax=Periweissella cryptocerci TaxID=2506420 RepID=A0A4P6YTP4_9LACO|nr:hypothetical protein [Periweissella cryptocerci]QBO36062.1 hypothetical protein EQG49_06110 [Periweissella cryptocerci]
MLFDPTKKRVVGDDVKALLPAEVINQLWLRVNQMRKDNVLVDATVAIAFSDDVDPDNVFIMVIQQQGNIALPYDIPYTGEKDFLGKGTIVIVSDKPKALKMTISELNK